MADIKIIEIEGYGHSFNGQVSVGSIVNIRFTYSLAPTIKAYPHKQPPLEGLVEGDIFRADISGGINLNDSKSTYTINNYKPL